MARATARAILGQKISRAPRKVEILCKGPFWILLNPQLHKITDTLYRSMTPAVVSEQLTNHFHLSRWLTLMAWVSWSNDNLLPIIDHVSGISLKRQCHEIFDRYFSSKSFARSVLLEVLWAWYWFWAIINGVIIIDFADTGESSRRRQGIGHCSKHESHNI